MQLAVHDGNHWLWFFVFIFLHFFNLSISFLPCGFLFVHQSKLPLKILSSLF